jgi:putative acetyltransferase
MKITIRNEQKEDERRVEEIVREAFWNLHMPGCDEHFTAHTIRRHNDFIQELNFVIEVQGELIGSIMYTRSELIASDGSKLKSLTFGPVCILPDYQKKGFGAKLILHSLEQAKNMGEKVICILGHPHNYVKYGFRNCVDFSVSDTDGRYPYGLLVLELVEHVLQGKSWTFHVSSAYEIDEEALSEYETSFPEKEKKWLPSQEDFLMAVRAYLDPAQDR